MREAKADWPTSGPGRPRIGRPPSAFGAPLPSSPTSVSSRAPPRQRVIAASGTARSAAATTSAPAGDAHPGLVETTRRMRSEAGPGQSALKTALVSYTSYAA